MGDKVYKEKMKAKNNQIKTRKNEIYETFRNKIVDIFRVSRKSCRGIWQNIHDIVYSKNAPSSLLIDVKTITKPKDLAEKFNNFFTSIEKNLQNNTPSTKNHYTDHVNHSNPESPTTPDEFKSMIKSLKSSNSVGPNGLPTKIFQLVKDKISISLLCKTAKIIPVFNIFKTETSL